MESPPTVVKFGAHSRVLVVSRPDLPKPPMEANETLHEAEGVSECLGDRFRHPQSPPFTAGTDATLGK